MQSCKYLVRKKHSFSLHHRFLRNLSLLPESQVLVQGKTSSRSAILNRPIALNALNTQMCARLKNLYQSWEENSDIGFIVLKGSGKAFCAGGDVVSLYRSINDGMGEDCKEFFKTIYSFIYLVGTYLKPHVALLNGVTMGGGAGISIPGMFRVVTERTTPPLVFSPLNCLNVRCVGLSWKVLAKQSPPSPVKPAQHLGVATNAEQKLYFLVMLLFGSRQLQVFATPETQIGFHPDAGASFYLSHLPGYLDGTGETRLLNPHFAFPPNQGSLLSVGSSPALFLGPVPTLSISTHLPLRIREESSEQEGLGEGLGCVDLEFTRNRGEYLALTGEKLNGAEMIASGLATHYSDSAKLTWIEDHLGKLVTDDPSVIESSLEKYGDLVYPDSRSVMHRMDIVDKCFSHGTVEEILDAIENEAARTNDEWCISTVKKLKEASPLGLKVSLRSIREGRYQSLDQCLAREYQMSLQGISKQISRDFCEGVRARLVDKDLAPKAVLDIKANVVNPINPRNQLAMKQICDIGISDWP
ncbi:hypothetical protein IFM89_011218 [Coptis chinensis]|uniref:3-hydroxyisobutyryl-CoA hydrolase n=2 Tax=Magnoliopsida TaxID=3398 RepID=A0A835HHA2_9MAGN|nr:hypothetical protein IFM89_011218 [Coptis chinensis]